jgi:hypothetical protein
MPPKTFKRRLNRKPTYDKVADNNSIQFDKRQANYTSKRYESSEEQILQERILHKQISEEKEAEESTTGIKAKAVLSGVKNARLYEDPRIFMMNIPQDPGEEGEEGKENIIRCCFTANEIIESILSHMKALNRDIRLSRSSPQKLLIYCYNNPDHDNPSEINVSFNAILQDGTINKEYFNQVLSQIRGNSSIFNQLSPQDKESILSMLQAKYSHYNDKNSFIRRVQAYSATDQKLSELHIDPKMESELTSLITGYENELKGKDINDYIRWFDDANAPVTNTLNNLDRTNIYLKTTFSQIERLFSIDMYHIIITTLKDHVPTLEQIKIGDTISLDGSSKPIPEATTFSDVLQQINDITDEPQKRNLNYIYKCYFLLKSLCFILHDKPVNEFVKILYEYIVLPMREYSQQTYPDIVSDIGDIIDIWVYGFRKGDSYVASQKRCHHTADELTRYFTEIMRQKGIIVPDKLLVYSMPYSVFKEDDAEKDLVREMLIHSNCKYGLADAVGNDFVNGLFTVDSGQEKIFTLTSALQDAAPPSRTHGPLTVISENINIDSSLVATNTASKSTTSIDLEKGVSNLHSLTFEVSTMITEPVRFGDIAIFTLQNGTAQPFVLYYLDPALHFSETTIDDLTRDYLLEFIYNLNTSWHTDVFNGYMQIRDAGDEGKLKILFGVSYGRISQNDTIPLIKHLLDMSKSARGRGPPANIVTLKWLAQNKNNTIENTVRVLLASFAKELGDQAKRNVVEIINRDPAFGGKGLLATVDTFLPHAFINGMCVVKAGNIEIYEQEGFRTIDRPTIINILKILEQYKDYGLLRAVVIDELLPQIHQSVSIVIDHLLPNIRRTELSPSPNIDVFKHILLYYGILSELVTTRLLIDPSAFRAIKTNYIANWQTPGFTDDISFMKRILFIGNIRELFAIYEKDIDTRQSYSITYQYNGSTLSLKNLQEIISKYYAYYNAKGSVFDFDEEINKILEEAPLFYLLTYWNDVMTMVPPRIKTRPPPIFSFVDYVKAVATKLSVFSANYIAQEYRGKFMASISALDPNLATMVAQLDALVAGTGPIESSHDDAESSQVEELVDYANNNDAQNIVDEVSPGVSVQIEESNGSELVPALPDPVIVPEDEPVIEPFQPIVGGKSRKKNRYSNRNLTKKLHRLRKTRKNTKLAKYIKKNVTKHRR